MKWGSCFDRSRLEVRGLRAGIAPNRLGACEMSTEYYPDTGKCVDTGSSNTLRQMARLERPLGVCEQSLYTTEHLRLCQAVACS